MNPIKKILELCKSKESLSSLKRAYESENALFISFLVALILEMLNFVKEFILNPHLQFFVVEIIIMNIIVLFSFIFVKNRSFLEIAIEIRERKLDNKEAERYAIEEYYAI